MTGGKIWKKETNDRPDLSGSGLDNFGFGRISISPTQKDMTPIMVIQSEMASLDESSAALVISGIRPVNAAYTMPVRIKKDQR